MLTSFHAQGYKNLRITDLQPGRVNVLIGPNNAGKSNLAEAVSLLWELLDSPGEGEFFDLLNDRLLIRTTQDPKSEPMNIDLRWTFCNDAMQPESGCSFTVRTADHRGVPFIGTEEAFSTSEGSTSWRYRRELNGSNICISTTVPTRNTIELSLPDAAHEQIDHVPLLGLTNLLAGYSQSGEAWEAIAATHAHVRAALVAAVSGSRRYHCSSFHPRHAARPVEASRSSDHLDEAGEPLATVLGYRLRNPTDDPKRSASLAAGGRIPKAGKDRFVSWLQPFLPTLRDVKTRYVGGLTWIELQLDGEWRRLIDLSDGTVQLVILATLLAFEHRAAVLWIDEPELNLHPAWAHLVASRLARTTAAQQIFISTHSPEILDGLTEAFRTDEARIFVVDARSKGDTIRRLMPDAVATALDEGWRLGDLYRVGDPRIGGWPW